jgi:hypothetical protein
VNIEWISLFQLKRQRILIIRNYIIVIRNSEVVEPFSPPLSSSMRGPSDAIAISIETDIRINRDRYV